VNAPLTPAVTAAELLAHELAPVALDDGERRLLAALVAGEMAPSYATEIRVSQMAEQLRTYPARRAALGADGALDITAALAIAAAHDMRPWQNAAEATTAAALLGLPPEAIEAVRRDWGKPSLDRRDVRPLPPLRSVGALAAWHREPAAGRRGASTIDDLWRAACWEQSAWNAEALGMHESAHRDMDRAAELLGVKPVATAQSASERPSSRKHVLSAGDTRALARVRARSQP